MIDPLKCQFSSGNDSQAHKRLLTAGQRGGYDSDKRTNLVDGGACECADSPCAVSSVFHC